MEDFLFKYLKYYESLPGYVKYPVGWLYSRIPSKLRYGNFYSEYNKRIKEFLACRTPEQVLCKQHQLLFDQVNKAIRTVPFYQRFKQVHKLEDFQQLPIVSKSDFLDNIEAFCSHDKELRLQVNSGGSSGTPFVFYLEKSKTRSKEKAHFNWFWGLWGYRPGAKILMLRGKPLPNNALYEIQSIKNCLNVSCYELTAENAPVVLKKISEFQPEFVHAYPSAVNVFLRCIGEKSGGYFDSVKALFLGSEFLDPAAKVRFENFFNAPACSWYGHTECALHAGAVPGNDSLLFFPFYGYFELLDDNNLPINEPGCSGRIVGTSFDNSAMPFIRYDTGDRGTLGEIINIGQIPCQTLQKVDGREQDIIFLSDSSCISLTSFIFGQHLRQFELIREMQLEQFEHGKILLRIVPLRTITEQDCRDIAIYLSNSVSGRLEISVELVDHIEKTVRGKHRFLIQHCKTI